MSYVGVQLTSQNLAKGGQTPQTLQPFVTQQGQQVFFLQSKQKNGCGKFQVSQRLAQLVGFVPIFGVGSQRNYLEDAGGTGHPMRWRNVSVKVKGFLGGNIII